MEAEEVLTLGSHSCLLHLVVALRPLRPVVALRPLHLVVALRPLHLVVALRPLRPVVALRPLRPVVAVGGRSTCRKNEHDVSYKSLFNFNYTASDYLSS